jgi:hypothetical protein
MTKRLAIGALAVGAVVLGLSYASAFRAEGPPAWVAWPFVVAMAAMLTAAMALGAARPGRGVGRLAVPFALTFVILVVCFGLALREPPPAPGAPLWLGLPKGAALVLYGVGLLPLLALPLTYALTFEGQTLSEVDLTRLRREAAAAQAGMATGRSSAGAGAGPPPQRQDGDAVAPDQHPIPAPRTTETV